MPGFCHTPGEWPAPSDHTKAPASQTEIDTIAEALAAGPAALDGYLNRRLRDIDAEDPACP